MISKTRAVIILMILAAIFTLGVNSASASNWTVGPGGNYSYTNITDAVTGAADSDTITVYDNGGVNYTYNENVIINKNLTLKASGNVTVNADNSSNPVFEITSRGSGTTIQGFTITGASGSYGIYLNDADSCNITGNNITGSQYGIYGNSLNSAISRNEVYGNWYGIYLSESSNNAISGNTVRENGYGITLESSSNNGISGNNIYSNTHYGILLENSNINTVSGNTITNNEDGIYLINSSQNQITGNQISGSTGDPKYNHGNGIIFSGSSSNTISGNNEITGNPTGIYLGSSSDGNTISGNYIYSNTNYGIHSVGSSGNHIISNNRIIENPKGVSLDYSSNSNTVSGNIITNNGDSGVYIKSSSSNTISGNTITGNLHGIYLLDSSGNHIIGSNQITGNTANGIYFLGSSGNNISGNNAVTGNSKGILLESSSNNNEISGNNVSNNIYGIWLENSNTNTISGNKFVDNIGGSIGEGNGITLVTSSGTIIQNNQIIADYTGSCYGIISQDSSNSIIHDNLISSNTFAGIKIYGTSNNNNIYRNRIINNSDGIQFEGSVSANVNFNSIVGNSGYAISNVGSGAINAENNWWGSNVDPVTARIFDNSGDGSIDADPWIVFNITASPTTISTGGQSIITVDLTHNSNGDDISSLGHIPDGTEIFFTLDPNEIASINDVSTTVNGIATAILIGVAGGNVNVSAYGTPYSNPEDAVSTSVTIGGPDLEPYEQNVSSTTHYTQTTYHVTAKIRNTGAENAGTFKVSLYDNGNLVEEKIINGLNVGQWTTLTWDWTPLFKETGNHELIIAVDPLNEIPEGNETNNNATLNVFVLGRPDLSVPSDLTKNGTIYTNVTYPVSATISNKGDANAGSFTVELIDKTASGSTSLGIKTVEGLAFDHDQTLTWDWTPLFGATGEHSLQLLISLANDEINGTNNGLNQTINVTGRTDLTVPSNLTRNGTIYTNVTYPVSATITNNGDTAAQNFDVELKDGSTSLGIQHIANLGVGAVQTLIWTWLPAFGETGNHLLQLIIYPLENVESNEINNFLNQTIAVTGRTDLNVPSSLNKNSTIYTNITYPVSATISNNGDVNAVNFDVELKDGATSLGTQHIDSLGIGNAQTLTWNWLPAFGATGNHILQLIIYSAGNVESNLTNNWLNETINVTGRTDLTIPSSLNKNSTIYTNITYPVSATITNNGDTAAQNFDVELKDGSTSLGIQHIANLGIGSNTILTWNWLPAFGATGNHPLQLIIYSNENVESNLTNNWLNQTVSVTGRTDLTIPSDLTRNGTIYTNITYPVSATITNNGDVSAVNFDVELKDGTTSLGMQHVNSLGIGSSTTLTWDWTPSFGATGNHPLQLIIYSNGNIESNLTNNWLNQTIAVTGRPDLVPSNIATNSTGTIYTGNQYSVTARITNSGDAATGNNFKVRLYDNGNLIGEKNVNALNTGAFTTLTWDWTPIIGTPGTHTLLITTDTDFAVAESNETNNNITSDLTVSGMPDLIAQNNMTTNSTGNIYTGIKYTVYTTIKNNRDAGTGNSFKVKLYDNGTSVAEQTVNGLNAGESRTLSWDWTPIIVGSHSLMVVVDSQSEIAESDENNNNNSTTFTAIGRPDLNATSIATNGTIYTNVTYPVSVTVKNNGDANAGQFTVELFDGATSLGTKTIDQLAINAETILTWNWTPAFAATGLHNLMAVIDTLNQQYEINETNNNIALAATAIGRPDLVPSNLTTNSTGTTYTGVQYRVTAKVTNNGDASTGSGFKVRLYDNGALVEEKTVSGLNINEFTTLTWNWTPAFGSTGIHTLLVTTDLDNAIFESNETNNNVTLGVTATGRPDLNSTGINTNGTIYTGITYPVNVNVKNNGDANSGQFTVELFDGSTSLGTQTVSGLAVNTETTLTWNWIPAFGTTGLHNLKAVIDSLDQQYEINETNNNITLALTATGRPDLVPSNLNTNGTIYTGITYPVNVTVRNNGDANSGTFTVELFDGLTSLGTKTIDGLAINANTVLTWSWTPIIVGSHTLKVVVDSLDQIYEFNEANNNITGTVTATGRPDLNATSITINGTIYTNVTYPVNVTVKNNGDANSGQFTVELFDGLTSLGTKTVTGLAINANTTLTWNWTPAFGTTGLHNLMAVIDTLNQQYEINETNNNITLAVTAIGRPDLVSSNITTNGTIYTGITYPVNVTVTNNGDGDAGTFTVKLSDGSTGIGWITINGLAAGTSTNIIFNWTPTTTGLHTLQIRTDHYNNITEYNETNNILNQDITVIGRPDLIPSNLTTNSTVYTGITYPVNVTVTNSGNANAGSFNVELFDGLTSLGTKNIDNLGIGANTILTWDWTPLLGTTGSHSLKIVVDSLNQIYESNENNNNLTATVTTIGRPDIVPSNLTTNETVYTNVEYPVSVKISNNGDASAGNFNVELFDGSTSLGIKNITNLGIGSSTTLTWNWIPLTVGTHTLKIVADSLDQIYEINDTNNITLDINTLGRPDLVPSNLTTNGTINTTFTYPVSVKISNNGDANAGNFNVELFDGSTSLGIKNIASLGMGASTTLTWNWTPAFGTTGLHNLKAVIDSLDQQYEINETNNNITLNVTATGRPDLVSSNITTNGTVYTGITYPVNVTITNNGDGDAGTFTVKLLDGSTGIGWITINGLAAGASTNITFNWTPTTAGLHTLLVKTDFYNNITEFNETNNDLYKNITVTTISDLIPTNLQKPNSPTTNITYPVIVTVKNNGTANASTFTVKLLDGTTGIGWITVNGLAAGASTNITFNWKPITFGVHSLRIITDFYNNIAESNETNNEILQNVTVITLPDLVPTNLQPPNNPTTGITYPVIVTVKNNGTANASTFTVKLYDGTTGIGWITVNGLTVGTSTTVTFNWKPTTLGLHTLRTITDTYNNITEINETNNEINQTTTVLLLPDLIPSNLQVPNNPFVGITYPITVKITNRGTANAGTFTVKLLDGTKGVGWITINGLAVGANTNVTFNWTPTTFGVHTLRIITDTYNNITEFNETNNEISQTITAISGPDLIPSNLQLPNNPQLGQTYPITVTISNTGGLDAGTFTVKLYDGTTGIGWITVNGLAAGTSTNFTFNWTPTTAGLHTLQVRTDYYNNITESNENNNQITQNITITSGPDLIPSNLQLPNNPQTGQTYPVTVTITNNGIVDSGMFTVKLYDGTKGIGWITVNGLAAGASTNITFDWTPTTAGAHTLQVMADYYNNITESNENNNQITQNITLI